MSHAVPRGMHTITPNLVVKDCARAIEFYKHVFAAEEVARLPTPDGMLVEHAELQIGDSILFLHDELEGGLAAPTPDHPAHVAIQLYVEDAERVFARALEAGATSVTPMSEGPLGDRSGTIADRFGYVWTISTHLHEVVLDREREIAHELEEPSSPPA
jgi:PhnB protein